MLGESVKLCPLVRPSPRPFVCPLLVHSGYSKGRHANVWALSASSKPGAAWVAKDARLLRRSALGYWWNRRVLEVRFLQVFEIWPPCNYASLHAGSHSTNSQGLSSLATLADQRLWWNRWSASGGTDVGRRSILADRISCPNAGRYLPATNVFVRHCIESSVRGSIFVQRRSSQHRHFPRRVTENVPATDCAQVRFTRSHTVRRAATISHRVHSWWSGPPDSG